MAEPQTLLAGRYRLVRQVGRGGMGVVWEARDERLERPVAVKQLRPQVGLAPEEAELAKSRAMREARITARLHHRNAVPVFDVVEHEGQPCLVMQFVPSVPLSTRLREGGPLDVPETAAVGAQVASALAAAHQLGIVHRDVKPGNVLMTDDGTAMISDFGISHALGDATLTSTGLVHGTLAYLAPEVARGASSSSASDVFSLGATLYAALEGAPPFGTDSNAIALLHRVASGEFAAPEHAGVLEPVLMEMLRADPGARPPMADVSSRLSAVGAGAPEAGSTLALPEPAGAREEAWTTQVRRTRGVPAPFAVPVGPVTRQRTEKPTERVPEPASAAAPEAALEAPGPVGIPPSSRSGAPGTPSAGRRRRGPLVALVLLVVALVVAGTVVVSGQLGGRGSGVAAEPATSQPPASSGSPDASGEPGPGAGSAGATSSASSTPERSPSPSPSATSASPSATPSSGRPTAAELEDAITRYYALVPGNTDQAWPLLTASYQRTTSGGRASYERFWSQVDSVSVSKVDATPPSRVDATVTYRRSSGRSVERTSFRLVRDGGTLKIDGSTVVSAG